tara:strand:- start:401 stop:1738 length:1338 start_codon:yes stop_codon:yes gene_type:complete
MKKVLLLVLPFITFSSFAQNSPQAFSLKAAQDYAELNSFSVQDKKLGYEKAKKQILETAAIGLPQLSVNADYTYNSQLAQTPLPDGFIGPADGEPDLVAFGVEHQTTAAFSLNQLIFDASYLVALKATTVVKDIANLNTEKAKIDIRSEIANTYFLVAVTKENVRLTEENVKTLKKNLFEVQEYFKNGLLEEQDADQVEILLLQQEGSLESLQRSLILAEKILKFQMGISSDADVNFTETIETLMSSNQSDSQLLSEKFDRNSHIDYKIMEAQRLGSKLQLQNQWNTIYPSLSGFLRHTESNFGNDNFNAFQFDQPWIPGTALGLSLRWNVFQGSGRIARIQMAKVDLERVDLALDANNTNLDIQYETDKSNFENALSNFNTQKRNLALSTKIRDRTRIKFKEGIASSLDLTQAENQQTQAQGAYFQAVLNLLNSKVQLAKTLGM